MQNKNCDHRAEQMCSYRAPSLPMAVPSSAWTAAAVPAGTTALAARIPSVGHAPTPECKTLCQMGAAGDIFECVEGVWKGANDLKPIPVSATSCSCWVVTIFE